MSGGGAEASGGKGAGAMTESEMEPLIKLSCLELAVGVVTKEPGLGMEDRVIPLARQFEAYVREVKEW